jgi:glycosyltransferase involved in cell wall biosynthesis
MRIVLVGPASPWRGGIAHFNDLLARELARSHETFVLSFTRQYPKLLFPGKSQKHPAEASLDVGAESLIDSIGPWSWYKTARRIRELEADLLVFRYWMPFFAPCFGSILRGAVRHGKPESVVIADNVVPHERRPLDGIFTRWFLARADRFVVMTKAVRRDLLDIRPDANVDLVPHPLYGQFGDAMDRQAARKQLEVSGDAELMLFFGFVRAYKGLDTLLRAMPAIRAARPRAHLLVVGEFYSQEERTRALARELELDDCVRFVSEYVPNDEVAPYFSAADVVVLPYHHATQSGIIPVAYHMGRPVVTTEVGGLAEVIEDNRTGILVPPKQAEALAAALIRFFAESLGPSMQEHVARARKLYTWERFAQAVCGTS